MALRHPIEYDELDGSEEFNLPPDVARAFFESEVRRLVGIDSDEFIRRYEAGAYAEIEDIPEIWNIFEAAFLIPLGKAQLVAPPHPIEYDDDDLDSPEGVTFLTGPAALEFFEREIQRLMGMSGDEFIRRYDAGEYRTLEDVPENWHVLEASFLIPFGRNNR